MYFLLHITRQSYSEALPFMKLFPKRARFYCLKLSFDQRLQLIKITKLLCQQLPQGVYIVDGGSRGVWAWVGPSAVGPAARGALAAARGLARARRHVGPVSVTAAGREPLEFAALFRNWRWCDARRDVRVRAARSATTRLDAVSLASNAWLAAEVRTFNNTFQLVFQFNVFSGSLVFA